MIGTTWAQVQLDLKKTIGASAYSSWIEPIRLVGLEEGIARFEVPTNFMRDWVSRNYSEQIRVHFLKIGVEVVRVEFTVPRARPVPIARIKGESPERRPRPASPASTPAATAGQEADGFQAGLDARFTFDSFVVGKPNELAHAAARRMAEAGRSPSTPSSSTAASVLARRT